MRLVNGVGDMSVILDLRPQSFGGETDVVKSSTSIDCFGFSSWKRN